MIQGVQQPQSTTSGQKLEIDTIETTQILYRPRPNHVLSLVKGPFLVVVSIVCSLWPTSISGVENEGLSPSSVVCEGTNKVPSEARAIGCNLDCRRRPRMSETPSRDYKISDAVCVRVVRAELTRCRLALKRASPWFSMLLANPQPKREIMRASFVCNVFLSGCQ